MFSGHQDCVHLSEHSTGTAVSVSLDLLATTRLPFVLVLPREGTPSATLINTLRDSVSHLADNTVSSTDVVAEETILQCEGVGVDILDQEMNH